MIERNASSAPPRQSWHHGLSGEFRRTDVLADAEQQIESRLSREDRSDYLKLVVVGMEVALHNGRGGLWAGLRSGNDHVADSAILTAELVRSLAALDLAETMTDESIQAATTTLLLGALEFAHQAGLVKIGPAELERAIKILAAALLHPGTQGNV